MIMESVDTTSAHDKVINAMKMVGLAEGRLQAANDRLRHANAEMKAASTARWEAEKARVKAAADLIELRWWEHVDDLQHIKDIKAP